LVLSGCCPPSSADRRTAASSIATSGNIQHRLPQHVRANLLFANTLGCFVLAPEVCFQDHQVSLFRRPKVPRHSRRARPPMYLPICRVVVMQEVHTRTEVHQKTVAVVGNRAVCILPSAAGWWFRSARLVPPGTVVEASVVGMASAANWSAIANVAARTRKHRQRNKLRQTSEVSSLAKTRTKVRRWGEDRASAHLRPLPNRLRPPTPGPPDYWSPASRLHDQRLEDILVRPEC
jgi:hypothetical protein